MHAKEKEARLHWKRITRNLRSAYYFDHETAILINAIRDAIDQPAEARDDSGLIGALRVVEGD